MRRLIRVVVIMLVIIVCVFGQTSVFADDPLDEACKSAPKSSTCISRSPNKNPLTGTDGLLYKTKYRRGSYRLGCHCVGTSRGNVCSKKALREVEMFVTHQVGLTLRLSILAVTVFFMSLVTSSAASALSCSAKTSMLCTFSATTTTPTSCPSGQKVDPRTKQCVDPNNLDYNNTAQPTVSPTAIGTNQSAVCEAIGSGADCADTNKNGGTKIDSLIKTVVNILTAVVGVLAVIMIIVSGAMH